MMMILVYILLPTGNTSPAEHSNRRYSHAHAHAHAHAHVLVELRLVYSSPLAEPVGAGLTRAMLGPHYPVALSVSSACF
jgi:hypothetical protein